MGRGEVEKKLDDKVEATLCPNCSYEHVIVPMFRIKKDEFHCLLCKHSGPRLHACSYFLRDGRV